MARRVIFKSPSQADDRICPPFATHRGHQKVVIHLWAGPLDPPAAARVGGMRYYKYCAEPDTLVPLSVNSTQEHENEALRLSAHKSSVAVVAWSSQGRQIAKAPEHFVPFAVQATESDSRWHVLCLMNNTTASRVRVEKLLLQDYPDGV